MSNPALSWIAVDWGTTHLRLWMMDGNDKVIARRESDRGMGSLTSDGYEPVLLDLVGDQLPETQTPVIICGMAGARQGWAEAPYASVPCAPPSLAQATRVATQDPRLSVHILPGLSQMSPPDVMRGEETQIAGFLASEPNFDGILCLPGTHSKWAHISAQEVVSFRTYMTGELFALLSGQSVLRHSIGQGWDDEAFLGAVSEMLSRPAGVAAELFGLRAAQLLQAQSPDVARARLSGLLIGMELAAARPYWLGQEVVILGAAGLAKAYETALNGQSAWCRMVDIEGITLQGLTAAHGQLTQTR
ncbi:2-dehydro-3-deoxygalactonokinase [Tropicibacter oceani]|uniref:2-dehydro-3-deoxygalactonokinase n=1 Tax=Tropicibacter oceani TaxID=3058420 RepID=A0ABY8QGP9_9RHOB|nr:2-dehydro-3-deoxygalactonokinase [Tropicibacter oceani]WGW03613.1 2-dehydro-3-deoxygalactonokinase [Tropicibacter oceani]